MNVSKELLKKAKTAKTAQELLELAKAENIELSDEELDNVAGGCGRDYEPSGETPKFHVGDRLAMVHPVIGRSVAVRVYAPYELDDHRQVQLQLSALL